ncbi:class I SAM-dependent methyltransferase [Actinopolymorpha pittospori]|uniref:2-polyprenyl-3-methyl-5-hydroxy-6-metoxy-1, 4-benzoquinol methylase n=1 Tax=Actinopolymorpha pittospori TaxID=648752 RepID=A0A927RHC8_9ACTN|nr:class I SAM-dependent methyltransferase [Actinopolymorpha pittospori]MBE1605086.1 2-polyprenyl-3-methyl-5-hydroxy-6-metoxy-1,4-benzoquinol methylase [Actinopolymorpha pittospori]
MRGVDPKDVVRRGYDAISHAYRADDADEGGYAPWIRGLRRRLPARGTVLDLGCGCGIPVARALSEAGHAVTGVDLSEVQIQRARTLVPRATFRTADATEAEFPAASFDAVVCLYALIHMPLSEQPVLLRRIATWLRPDGWFLASGGHQAWTGTEDDWLGAGATMWWSHADTATYRTWIIQAGLVVTDEEFVPEDESGHSLFWARRPATATTP